MMLPLKRGKTVNYREQLLIGGELFELDDSALYRSNGMVFGHTPDHIQRGLKGLEVCRTLRPDRGALPKLARVRRLAGGVRRRSDGPGRRRQRP